jgi:hypothetical protein
MAKIAHLYGVLRSADIARKSADNTIWGCRGSMLTEPEGDTIDLVAFDRVIDTRDFLALKGQEVHAIVEIDVTSGSRGGAFLNVSVHSIEPRVAMSAVPSVTPADEVGVA